MRAFLMPAVVAAVQITSPSHPEASQMRDTFYSLAEAKKKNGGKIDEETRSSVAQILQVIDEQLMEGLWCDRDAAQKLFDGSRNQIVGCNHVDLSRYENQKEMTVSFHDELTGCWDQERDMCEAKCTDCCDLDEYTGSLPVCDDTALEEVECANCTAPPTQSALYDALQCLMEFEANHFQTWTDKWNTCRSRNFDLSRASRGCDSTQEHFEMQKCNEQRTIHEICNLFDNCYSEAETAHSATIANVRALEDIFQNQYIALQCLKCYGNEILQETTNLERCENAASPTFECVDGNPRQESPIVALALCMPNPPPPFPCNDEKDHCVPGTACFVENYYSAYTGEVTHSCRCGSDQNCACPVVDDCRYTCIAPPEDYSL